MRPIYSTALVLNLLFGLALPAIGDTSLLYVSLLNDKQIVAYDRNVETGKLTKLAVNKVPAEPGVLAVSPDHRVLFAAFRSTGQIASFRINRETGELTPISVVAGGDDPAYLEVDRTGKFLFAAYYVANKVSVNAIASDGSLGEQPLQAIPTDRRAHALAIDSKNMFAFVPHTGANKIFQFRFDASSGKLAANDPPSVSLSEGDEPRHIALHPSDRWAYSNGEAGDNLNVFEIKSNGTLRRIQRESTIPADFDKRKNTTARCEITRDGRFMYVANRGHHSIAGFAIDQQTGQIRSLGQFPTEQTPRSFTIAPDGRFLYAAGQDSGKITMYRVGNDGKLTREATYSPGMVPWCLLAVE